MPLIEVTATAQPDAAQQNYSMHSFGAIFAEVAVDPDLGQIRAQRIVAAYGVGNIMNAKTARSQMIGGIIFGLGMALLEETLTDPALWAGDECRPRRVPHPRQRRHPRH